MRAIPGMVVLNPADDVEARAAVHAAYDHVGPVYLRFGRLAVPVFNDEATYRFEIGKGIVLKEGKDVSVFATGLCVNEAREAEKLLAEDRKSGNDRGTFRDRRTGKCRMRHPF